MPRMPFYSDLGNLGEVHECLNIPKHKLNTFSQMILSAFLASPKAILRASQIIAQLSRAYPKTVSYSELRINGLDLHDIELMDWLVASGILETDAAKLRSGRVARLTSTFVESIPRGHIKHKFRPTRKMAEAVRAVTGSCRV
jgi:hypothetical protein